MFFCFWTYFHFSNMHVFVQWENRTWQSGFGLLLQFYFCLWQWQTKTNQWLKSVAEFLSHSFCCLQIWLSIWVLHLLLQAGCNWINCLSLQKIFCMHLVCLELLLYQCRFMHCQQWQCLLCCILIAKHHFLSTKTPT